ncbi:MAG: hypothetical protein C4339_06470 [Nitrososphaerota archaeon]
MRLAPWLARELASLMQFSPGSDQLKEIEGQIATFLDRLFQAIADLASLVALRLLGLVALLSGLLSPALLALGALLYFTNMNRRRGREFIMGGLVLAALAFAWNLLR